MIGLLYVDYASLQSRAAMLERMAADVAATVPRIAAVAVRSGLHELVGFGIYSSLPVAADLLAICLPGTPGSLPDAAAELLAMSVAVRAADVAYRAVDAANWARSELPTAEALIMLAAWNRLHRTVNLGLAVGVPVLPEALDWAGEHVLEQSDRWIEGAGSVREVDPRAMPPLSASPAADLESLLGTVNTISDARHPSTAALLSLGGHPPRYVLCLPGLQDAAGPDGGAADLPGAIATLTGHSSYIRGMREVLATLPAGSRVLLVGHSQGGMVAEALAEHPTVGRVTIAGVLTAGSPLLAGSVAAGIPYLALQNDEDPVPKLGQLAGEGLRTRPPRGLVRFSTPGGWPSGSKHGLGSGGYLAEAGSAARRIQAFRHDVDGFLTPGPVDVRYLQVTDTDGVLPP